MSQISDITGVSKVFISWSEISKKQEETQKPIAGRESRTLNSSFTGERYDGGVGDINTSSYEVNEPSAIVNEEEKIIEKSMEVGL